jgi:hypothetical protein
MEEGLLHFVGPWHAACSLYTTPLQGLNVYSWRCIVKEDRSQCGEAPMLDDGAESHRNDRHCLKRKDAAV